jgi:short-subunit dehydrogenase
MSQLTFRDRYGPWAVIAGASQGIGRSLAHRIAAGGINCVLIARRQEPLDAVAAEIRAKYAVECVTAAIDLSSATAMDQLTTAVGPREVGLYVSNAGADTNGAQFLDRDVDAWVDLINLNVLTTVRCCHHFGGPMRKRRKGGILLVGSGACYSGTSFTAVYAGAKAFELCFAEGLWSGLRKHDVHVLFCALGPTDTPAFRALLERKGVSMPSSSLASPDKVAEAAFDRLPQGPVWHWGQEDDVAGHAPMSASALRARVLAVEEGSKRIFGES